MENLRCYAKISIENLLWNFENIKRLTDGKCEIFPVIKADAYGHGAVAVAKALTKEVKCFAVAEINEAITLREGGIENDILVLGYTAPSLAEVLSNYSLTQTVTDLSYAKALSKKLGESTLSVHIKLNTGMNRLGFSYDTSIDELRELISLKELSVKGIFSHFAESDNLSSDYTDFQIKNYNDFLKKLEAAGLLPEIRHICNSAGTLTRPDAYMSGVRPGIILYGAYPSEEVRDFYLSRHPDRPFREVMTFVARVSQIRHVKKGEYIGYCRSFKAERDIDVAIVSAGYADGIPRYLSNLGKVKIGDKICSIVGNVCMDLLTVDVTDTDAKVGDEVFFWGEEGLSVEYYADVLKTISYTLYTGVSPRVERKYI